ncbi:MAG: isoprenylcysteine carboxylmethyltransferase family protein [Chloroflexota bacterium]
MRSFKTTLGTIVVVGGFCFLVPYFILMASPFRLPAGINLLQIFASLVAACGLGMVVWVSVAFVRKGQGTPIPIEPPTRLVIHGLYRLVRNPMYVGAVLILLGEALFFRSGWLLLYATGLWATLHTFLVVFEEPQLRQRFGSDFEQYLISVPRWIPRIPARGISIGDGLDE